MNPRRRSRAARCARTWLLGTLVVAGAAGWTDTVSAQSSGAVPASIPATWWLRLRSTGYAFETATTSGAKLDRFGGYQDVRGAVTGLFENRVALHVGGRIADDLYLEEKVTTRTRLHTGFVELRHSDARARLGRQFHQAGAMSLSLDGATLTIRPARTVDATVWGGVRAPADRDLDVAALDEAGAFGAELRVRPVTWVRTGISFAYRERDGLIAERPVALTAESTPIPRLRVVGRAVYDLETETWSRAQAQAQWQPVRRAPTVTAQIVDRRQSIDAASYFARFLDASDRIRVGRASVRWLHTSGIGGEVEVNGTYLRDEREEDRTSTRFGAALIVPQGRVGYSMRVGDLGEETGFFGQVGIRPAPWLHLAGGATRITYALMEDVPEEDERELITSFAAAQVAVRPGLDLHVEVQSLENPIFSEDIRILAGVDITAGRGSSRFGLDRGGFFQ